MTEQAIQSQLAAVVAPFARALRSFPRSPDEAIWLATPEYVLTIGDMRRLVAAVARANR